VVFNRHKHNKDVNKSANVICGLVGILLSDDSNKTVNQFNEPAG